MALGTDLGKRVAMRFERRSPLVPLAILLGALVVPLSSGCGDDVGGVGDEMGDDGGGGGAYGSGNGATGTTSGPGSPSVTAGTSGSGGPGDEGWGEAPPPIPPQEEPEDVACEDLDPASPVVLYLSADDSNSMASPAEAREALRAGTMPYSVRTFEFLNYYDVTFPSPEGDALALFAEAERGDEDGTVDLLLAVRSPEAAATRRPITLTLVLDTSGSMEGTPMERQRAAIRALAGQLRGGDVVSLVTWNTDDRTLLAGHAVSGPYDADVVAIADALVAGGGTDLDGGLRAGYELANQHYGENRLNRVVLISDGGANVGVTEGDLIGAQSQDADAEGIYLVGVGVGPLGAYSDALMDTVTDLGRGAYVYLDSNEEAERILGDRFDETMEVAARAVQVEVTLPWYFQMKQFYGEEYSEDPEEVEPQHLAPGDTTAILQTLKACSPDVIDPADPVRLVARWETPLARQPREAVLETTVGALLAGDASHLAEAEAIVAYAEAMKAPSLEAVDAAQVKIDALADRDDDDLTEIGELLRTLRSHLGG